MSEKEFVGEGTYGGDGVDEEGDDGDDDDGDCGGARRARVARTPLVQRVPAPRGARSTISPTSNCLKVRGT